MTDIASTGGAVLPWRYHSGLGALEYVDPVNPRMRAIFSCKALRMLGYQAEDLELRKSLPRSDADARLVVPGRPPPSRVPKILLR